MQSVRQIAATYKSSLKRFVCVYQVQFDGFLAPGVGDYIRGCFCMLQLLEIMNKHCGSSVEFEMDMRNHPMSKWLSLPEGYNVRTDVPYSSLTNFHVNTLEVSRNESDIAYRHVLKEIVDKVNNFCKGEEHYDFMCRPEVFADISDKHKKFMQSRFKPSPTMESYIQEKMDSLGIISGEYSVIHVRTRDEFTFPPKPLQSEFLAALYDAIKLNIDPSKRYLLITSHKGIKDFFIRFTNICMLIGTNMCHLGQDISPSEEAIRDTMLDFFLLSRASEIIGISPYGVSGFSNECAKLFDIPFNRIDIPDPSGMSWLSE